VTAELLADGVGEELPGRDRTETARGRGERFAGVGAQLDIGCGDVELELLDTRRSGYGDHVGQASAT
jgi:hypothetical protein